MQKREIGVQQHVQRRSHTYCLGVNMDWHHILSIHIKLKKIKTGTVLHCYRITSNTRKISDGSWDISLSDCFCKTKTWKIHNGGFPFLFLLCNGGPPPDRKSSSKSASQEQAQATEAMAEPAYTIPVFRDR